MRRAYYDAPAHVFGLASEDEVLGQLTRELPFALDLAGREAWRHEIRHLKSVASDLPDAHLFLEFMIPRMGRRADAVIVYRGAIFVIEYKVGAANFDRHAIEQVQSYALDLKHFHETSHHRPIVPVLIATRTPGAARAAPQWDADGLCTPQLTNGQDLAILLDQIATSASAARLDASTWVMGRYKPTPTIIEAAQALYRGHAVDEISRSEAGAENLTVTADAIARIIEDAKIHRRKVICFVTGVPGSGKTLAGLNLANQRMRADGEEHAVFLSGNGPLVQVLRRALADDAVRQKKEMGEPRTSRVEEERRAAAFIQNIHHFRDEAITSETAPVGKVVVFDEAQRAWDVEQASLFMRERGHHEFDKSEPEFLLSVMDRHPDWCAVICLVGNGQEINTGEAGISEWHNAIYRAFGHWKVYMSDQVGNALASVAEARTPALHLSTSIRSFRAERLAEFVDAVIDGEAARAAMIMGDLGAFPIRITRDLQSARQWLRMQRRAQERTGLLASSNALRLKPEGIYVKAKVDPPMWFLAGGEDVRSSNALEDAATEFEVQGLELDWTGVCWDANYRWEGDEWFTYRFRGTRWERVSDERRRAYVANSYRVLLTRARQGMVIFVPPGDIDDPTRFPALYDPTHQFLLRCGIQPLAYSVAQHPLLD